MCPFGETPIPTELKVRLFCNIGCRRCNESTRLTKRNTRQNILHLDLCTITARWNKVLILGTWNATHLLPSVSRNICITPFITGTLSNTACSLSSPWAWQSSRNISADRVCLFDKVSVLGDTIKGTPVYIYTHILMGHLYISTHNYILMGHSVHIYTQLHTDGTPCIYLHTITYCLDILYISTHNTYWWDTLYISTHNYILMGQPVYIYTQLHTDGTPCIYLHTITYWWDTLYISTHNYILMGHTVYIYTQLHTDGTPCIYLHTITYWWDTLYISKHNYILMGHPVYIYTQLHTDGTPCIYLHTITYWWDTLYISTHNYMLVAQHI